MLLTYYSAIVATILGAQIVQAAPADIRAARSPSTVADVVSSPEVQPAEGVVGGENNIVDDFEEPPIPAFPPPLMVRSRNAHWFVVIKHQGKTVCNGMWVTHTLVLTTARCAATFQAVEDGENDAHDPSDMSIHTVDTEVPVELVLLAGVDSVIYDSTAIFVRLQSYQDCCRKLLIFHFNPF